MRVLGADGAQVKSFSISHFHFRFNLEAATAAPLLGSTGPGALPPLKILSPSALSLFVSKMSLESSSSKIPSLSESCLDDLNVAPLHRSSDLISHDLEQRFNHAITEPAN